MPNISSKKDFLDALEKFTYSNNNVNFTDSFPSNKIKIEETEEDGKGEIYIDITSYSSHNIFFIKINHLSVHAIGKKKNHNDGIVLKVNLSEMKISVFLFELKKQLRFNKLEKAAIQLTSAYKFIKYMQFEECFEVDYQFHAVYETNNLPRDADSVKTFTRYQQNLFNSVFENKSTIPLLIPFCSFKEFNFKQISFGSTINI